MRPWGRVKVLEAELTGDPVQVAKARLLAARKQSDVASEMLKIGILNATAYEKAKGNVAIAEAEFAKPKQSRGATRQNALTPRILGEKSRMTA